MKIAWRRWIPGSVKRWIRFRQFRNRNRGKERAILFDGTRFRNQKADPKLRPGCNLIGYAKAESGLGEHIRLVGQGLLGAGIPFGVVSSEETVHREDESSLDSFLSNQLEYRANLICYNGNLISQWYLDKSELFQRRYNIGYGYWELSEYPQRWLYSMNALEEIWAPSRFIQKVILESSTLPVLHMPPGVNWKIEKGYRKKTFGLPSDSFNFLYVFDFVSFHRKNPMGVVEAFRRAFPATVRDVSLVLKTKAVEVGDFVPRLRELKAASEEDPRIILIDRYLDKDGVLGLISLADCYVSLHRSEGYGLTMAEAMALGKPVVATGYSGNLDFMTEDNSFLVDYDLVPVEKGEYFGLEQGSVWAQPRLSEAAEIMKLAYSGGKSVTERSRKGKEDVQRQLAINEAGARYRRRLRLLDLL